MPIPPLAWLPEFTASISRALGQEMQLEIKPSVNPLMYTAIFRWGTPISLTRANELWNYFQQWATNNDCIPVGSIQMDDRETTTKLVIGIAVKRRLGAPKNNRPWG
jgi:hypothetical protein